MRLTGHFAIVCALLLAGCAYTVGDGWFFTPRPIGKKAATAEELKLNSEERLTASLIGDKLPDGYMPTLAGRVPAKVTHQFIDLGGQKIAMTRVKAANGTAAEPLILACMGQSGTRVNSGDYYAEKLLPWGEVILFDYPGYGDSTGKPDVANMLALQNDMPGWIDAQARGRPLVLWGHSLGGPICAGLAGASKQADAVVLETTAPNFVEMMKVRKPWFAPPFINLQLDDKLKVYDVAQSLAQFNGPIMVIGGGKDTTLPPELSRKVAELLKAEGRNVAYLEIPAANHMNATMNSQFSKDAWPFFQALLDTRH